MLTVAPHETLAASSTVDENDVVRACSTVVTHHLPRVEEKSKGAGSC